MPQYIYNAYFIIVFCFGAVFGSFLNVCIYRLPEHQSIVTVPSHCMTCGYDLKWYDLIPIISYICLRGKCRKCGEKISPQYPVIESLNAIVWTLIFILHSERIFSIYGVAENLLLCGLFSALLVLSVIDFRTYEIPEGVNIFIAVLGGIATALDYRNWLGHLLGLIIISVPLLIIYIVSKKRAMGGGDVKLMAAAGLFLGWKNVLVAFMIGVIIAAIVHPIRMKVSKASKVLALGPYLSLGIMIAALFGDAIVAWYLSLLYI